MKLSICQHPSFQTFGYIAKEVKWCLQFFNFLHHILERHLFFHTNNRRIYSHDSSMIHDIFIQETIFLKIRFDIFRRPREATKFSQDFLFLGWWFFSFPKKIPTLLLYDGTNICLLTTITHPYLIIGWEDEVLGPGDIWGRVQGVGSDHWGTRSLPSLGLHPREALILVEFGI